MSQDRYAQVSSALHAEFLNLAVANSPENIAGDGEHSHEMQTRMRNDLARQWKALENKVGHSVSEDDVWRREVAAPAAASPRRMVMR
jgi:hypothetical protein